MRASVKMMLRVFAFSFLILAGVLGPASISILMYVSTTTGRITPAAAVATGTAIGVGCGLFFGVLLAAILGTIQLVAVRRLGLPLNEETLAVTQRRELTLDVPFAEAFDLCTATARRPGRAYLSEDTDYATGVIWIVRDLNWRSFGERIRLQLRDCGGRTGVVIECFPVDPVPLIDYGSSLRNMDAIVGFLLTHGGMDEGLPATKGNAAEGVRPALIPGDGPIQPAV